MPFCLGRQPADPVMLAKAPQLAGHKLARMPPPPVVNRDHYAFNPDMDGNDTIGDCTAVALANCARAAAVLAGYAISIPTDKVVAFYSLSTGYVAGDPSTDLGAVEALVLAYQAQHSFDIGGQTPLVGAWGTFDPADRALMANCVAEVGSCYIGVNLSVSDQNVYVWDTNTPSSAGDPTPGSWGAHAPMVFAYTGLDDTDLVQLGTWGSWQMATWRWIKARCDEAHGIAWRQLGAAGNSGVDYDRLMADADLFSSSQTSSA